MRKKRILVVFGCVSVVSVLGLHLLKGNIINFVGYKLIGAESQELDPDSLTMKDFSDIPGVTEEYVNAYKLFLKAKAGDKAAVSYSDVVKAFSGIADTTKNPELKLRSLYIITLCNFLDNRIDEAYKSGMEVVKLSKELYQDDKRVKLLDRIITLAEKKELTPSVLKGLIKDEEANSLVEQLGSLAEGPYQIKKMKERKPGLEKEEENFFKDFSTPLPLSADPAGVTHNLIPGDSSFETGTGILTGGEWQWVWDKSGYEIVANNSVDGRHCLKVKAGITSIPIATEIGKTYTFSFYAKTTGPEKVTGRMYMTHPAWQHNVFLPITITSEWTRYSLTMKAQRQYYWLGINIDGTALVDAYQFEEGDKATVYKNREPISVGVDIPSEYNYVFLPGEEIKINLGVYKAWPEAETKNLVLSYKITDIYKNIIEEKEEKISLDKEGRYTRSISVKPNKLGLFTIRYSLKRDSNLIYEIPENLCPTFAVVNPPLNIEKVAKSFCGVFGKGTFPGAGLKRIGVHWIEVGTHWRDIERIKGEYNWENIDNCISSAKKEGYLVNLGLYHSPSAPEWSWDKEEANEMKEKKIKGNLLPSQEHLGDWQEFIHQLVMRYKDVVDIYEIGAEDDLTLGHDPFYMQKYPDKVKSGFCIAEPVMDRYAEMIRIACEEIKKVNPEAKIGAVRPSGVDCTDVRPRYTFSEEVFKRCGKEFNFFPLDPYCHPRFIGPDASPTALPDDFLPDDLKEALELGKKYGGNQHIYISEFGYSLDINEPPDSKYTMEMVKRLSRTYLIARSTKNCDYCFWTKAYREGEKYDYGLWRDGYPTATVPAYSMVARAVENVVEAKEIDLGENVRAVVFKKPDKEAVGALYLIRGEGKVSISANPKSISILDVMGNPVKTEIKGKEIDFEIGELPVYLSIKGGTSFSEMTGILSSARLHITPVKVSFATASIDKGTIYLENQLNQKIVADVSYCLRGKTSTKKVTLSQREKVSVEVVLPEDIINRKEEVGIVVDCGKEFEKVSSTFSIEFQRCNRVTSPIKIDGDLSEWKGCSFIQMNERSQIVPPDPWISWEGPEDLSAKVWIGWDKENFYLAAQVTDDKHFNNKNKGSIWNGDAIQFAFDPWADAEELRGYGVDDYDLGVALTKEGPVAYQWHGSEDIWKNSEFAVVRDETNKKTFYEVRIPLIYLHISSRRGSVFGFNFVIFDDDTGAGQNYWYQLSRGITGIKAPYYFKKFALIED